MNEYLEENKDYSPEALYFDLQDTLMQPCIDFSYTEYSFTFVQEVNTISLGSLSRSLWILLIEMMGKD